MIEADSATKDFVRLLDNAIVIAEKKKVDSSVPIATIENLKSFRDLALSGRLPRPSKGEVPQGTGLGLVRGVGEWTEDDVLLDAVHAAEEFYRKFM